MTNEILSCSGYVDVLPDLVTSIKQHLISTPVIFLKGNLGAGKTTISQAILNSFGVLQQVTSPTFNIVNTYSDADNKEYYHFDLYRIKHIAELEDIGFYEYIDSGRPCLIEWPEIILDQFAEPHLLLEITQQGDSRSYTLSKV
jgi:tRNA threonylcarbamoyladenosine biosynthesis protein TsaE